MVQIIRRTPHKTTSDYMAEALRAYGEGQGKKEKENKLKEERETENKKLKELGIDAEGLSPEIRKIYTAQKLKEIGDEKKYAQEEERINKLYDEPSQKKSIGNQLVEGEPEEQPKEETPQENILEEKPRKPKEIEKTRKKWTDAEIAKENIRNPKLAKIMQDQNDITIREERAEQEELNRTLAAETKANQEYNKELRKETLPYRQQIAEKADMGMKARESNAELDKLIDTGNLDDPTFATLMDALPFNIGARFLSKETVAYKGELVQGYNILKSLFTGATRIKEIEIAEDKLANVYLTDNQKKSVLKSLTRAADMDVIRGDAAVEVEEEIQSGKLKQMGLLQFKKEVDTRAKKNQNNLFDRIIDQQQSVLKDAENLKKMPIKVDFDQNSPEMQEIIDQALIESGFDWKKATESLTKKGYTVE